MGWRGIRRSTISFRQQRNRAAAIATAVLIGASLTAATAASAAPSATIDTGALAIVHQMNEAFDPPVVGGDAHIIADVDVDGAPVSLTDDNGVTPQGMWDGASWNTPEGNPWGYALQSPIDSDANFTPEMLGTIQPVAATCEAEDVTIRLSGTLTNNGPADGVWTVGSVRLINQNDPARPVVDRADFGAAESFYPVGTVLNFGLEATVPLADLQAGAIDTTIAVELAHLGVKSWEVSDFLAEYELECDPVAPETPAADEGLPATGPDAHMGYVAAAAALLLALGGAAIAIARRKQLN